MSQNYNLQEILSLNKTHQQKTMELLNIIYQPSEELMDQCIEVVGKQIKNHSFFSINLLTIKQLKQEIQQLEGQFKQKIDGEQGKLNRKIQELTQTLRQFIQNLIEYLRSVKDTCQDATQKLNEQINQIERDLLSISQNKYVNIVSMLLISAAIASGIGVSSQGAAWTFIGIPIAVGGIIAGDQIFVYQLKSLKNKLIEEKQNINQKKQDTLLQIQEILNKSIQIFIEFSQNVKAKSIVWCDKDINNNENSALCQKIQNHFKNINNFYFTNNLESLKSYLNKTYIVHLILQGSISQQILEQINELQNIHSVIIYCQMIKKYEGLKDQYQLVTDIVNQQDKLIQVLETRIKYCSISFGQINFYQLPNYFQKHPVVFYFLSSFSISQLQPIQMQEAKNIVERTLDKCPAEVITLDQNQQTQLATLIEQHFKNKKINDVIKLYTLQSNFYILINKILLTLNEDAILESKLLIQSLNFSLEEYEDNQNYQEFFKKDFRLYRGINYPIKSFQIGNKMGDLIVFPGFTSTSDQYGIASRFASQNGMIFSISFDQNNWKSSQFKKSRPKSISNASQFMSEREYLFPSFSCFVIKEFRDNIVELEYIKL